MPRFGEPIDDGGELFGEAPGMELDVVIENDKKDMKAALNVLSMALRERAEERYAEMRSLVASLGQNGRKFRREAARNMRATVSEVYSAPRVSEAARRHPRMGLLPGLALDLTTCNKDGAPWNFNDPEMRAEAERLIDLEKPVLLIGTPMCTAFSHIQNLNKKRGATRRS